jgi:uncharacterized protein (TIGR00106 family)
MMGEKVVAEIQIVVLGTGNTSMSSFVATAAKALEEKSVTYEITPMGTVMEGTLDEVLGCVKAIHKALFNQGVRRVVTHLSLDDRRDAPKGLKGKVASVKEKLAENSK